MDKADEKKKEIEEKAKTLENAGLAGAATEVVQRYGSANKEHLVAYSGIDNELGNDLNLSLKRIGNWESPKNYREIKTQAGKAAEVKAASRQNAEIKIAGGKNRVVRTGDLPEQKYGDGTIGTERDQIHDLVEVDSNNKPILGTSSQMKFEGKTPKEALQKLAGQDHKKYLDANEPLEVPSDFYDGIKKEAQEKIEKLQKQVDTLKTQQGKDEIIKQRLDEIEKYKKIRKNLKKSSVSNKEAIEARLHPKISTAKDIVNISNRAGIEQAKMGAAISGGMSLIRNTVAVITGDKEPDEAALAVVKDTGTGAVVSYTTAFAGSVIKGGMQNSANEAIKSLSKTNLPAQIVTAAIEISKTMKKYFAGDIDGVECLTELGEKGTGTIASAIGAVIGQAAIPIPVVGGFIGSMAGYALNSAYYNSVVSILKDAKLTRQERERIEEECAAAIAAIKEWRAQFEQLVSQYMIDHIVTFHKAFDDIKTALEIGDIDGFIAGTNTISRKLGKTPQFETFNEFDTLMKRGNTFKL